MYHQCGGCVANQLWLVSSGCPVLAKSKYPIRHDIIRQGKHIHWLLLKKHGIPTENMWYSHVPNVVT